MVALVVKAVESARQFCARIWQSAESATAAVLGLLELRDGWSTVQSGLSSGGAYGRLGLC
jgi:hypothetical protein